MPDTGFGVVLSNTGLLDQRRSVPDLAATLILLVLAGLVALIAAAPRTVT